MTNPTDFMSSTALLGKRDDLSESQIACIDLLKDTLAEAMEGKIYGIAIAVAMDGGYGCAFGGARPAELNMACDDLKRQIMDAANKPKPKSKPSNILRARMT